MTFIKKLCLALLFAASISSCCVSSELSFIEPTFMKKYVFPKTCLLECSFGNNRNTFGPRVYSIYDFQNSNDPFHYAVGLEYKSIKRIPDLSLNYWNSPYQEVQHNMTLGISKTLVVEQIKLFPIITPQYEIGHSIGANNNLFHYPSIGFTSKFSELLFMQLKPGYIISHNDYMKSGFNIGLEMNLAIFSAK